MQQSNNRGKRDILPPWLLETHYVL